MELQFHKTELPYLNTVARELRTQEHTQEVRLTDGMPDIGKIIASWGQVLLRGKEWRSGHAGASCGVMVWVLYSPEDGSEPRCVETWIPFQTKWDFPDTDRDGILCVFPALRNIDTRTLSARKMMVRAVTGVLGEAMVPAHAEVYSPGDLPEDVCVLKNTYPLELPAEAGEKTFDLEETLTLPASAPGVKKILRTLMRPELVDSKIVADKVVMRGVSVLDMLYMGDDGKVHNRSFEIPFSQYAQLDKEYGDDAAARISMAVTALELEQGEEENLNLKAGLAGQYVISERKPVELTEDIYSPVRTVTPQMTGLNLPSVIDRQTQTLRAELPAAGVEGTVADVVFYPDQQQTFREADKVSADLSGVFQVLTYDKEDQLHGAAYRWQEPWSMDADENVKVDIAVRPGGNAQTAQNGSLLGEMYVDTLTTAENSLPMVTGVEMGPVQEPDPDRPSMILRRAGTDSLWSLAKKTGSTVEAIKKANNLTQEPEEERMLLIPVI